MSLRSDLNTLMNEFLSGNISSVHLQKKSARVLHDKIDRVTRRLKKAGFNVYITSWDQKLLNDEIYFFNELSSSNSDLMILLGYEIDIEFYFMNRNGYTKFNRLYDCITSSWLESFSYNNRLLYKDSSHKIRTWSYIESLSSRNLITKNAKPYTKHLYNKRQKNLQNSMYSQCINPPLLESLVIEKGVGLIKSPRLAYFFAKCNKSIGKLANTGGNTDLVKVQVEQRLRPARLVGNRKQKQGVFYVMHGYPISDGDLQKDTGKLYNNVISNLIQLP
ncbi:hypothetical protein BOO25_21235 [Vibrio navarrensis]|uniref:hypothetical protein n=1 Tax=Vibrio navarrensis TaxID=29495 RepID=UPI00192F91CF|nr:hypothetical protein [Vibrio navarrensis]MBE3671443.1 hypothetical protein [Vibrio navarrensis]